MQPLLDSLPAAGALMQYNSWIGSSGVAELGTTTPVDPAGYFRIASVTKSFTATVVLQLVGEGALSLDSAVVEDITLRQLLNHTSGLYNYTESLPPSPDIVAERFEHWDPQRALDIAARHDRLFAPGTQYSYSNTNYIHLGLIIEATTGRAYSDVLRERIFEPLQLRHTFLPGDDPVLPEPHAHGYLSVDGRPVDVTEFNTTQAWAAGGLVSTAADLNRFYTALFDGELLQPRELQEMQTTVATDSDAEASGLGLARYSLPGLTVWGHTGSIFGYQTWSYHSASTNQHFTLSLSTRDDVPGPDTLDLLTRVFLSHSDGGIRQEE